MIERQKSFVAYLEQLATLLDGTEIAHDLQLVERVNKTELLVPVVGAFSAGKSSLLNTLMGKSVLPVGIAPETELATELRYSPEPYLLAIDNHGAEERLPVDALKTINARAKELSHLQLYIDSPAIKQLAPLVLIDMPGYGSSLESHNKAIAFYLPRGVHFVVVTSVEDGNLTQSMVRRLDEVKAYGGSFTFVLSKANLRSPAQVEEVRGYIDEQLHMYFEDSQRTLLSGKDNSDAFAQALQQIDPNALFDRLFLDLLKGQNRDVIRQVNLALSTLAKGDAQSEQELRALEQALTALEHQKANMRDEMSDRYSLRLLNRCLRGLEEDLEDAVEELAALAANPQSSRLNNVLSEVVRNSLTRNIQREIDDISSAMIDDLAAGLTVRDMLTHHGDIHHIFPKNFLKNRGLARSRYNQVANFVFVQQEVNIKIGHTAPATYMADVLAQCESGEARYGAITRLDDLKGNLAANCLPEELAAYQPERFEEFLAERRRLMAQKIKQYYRGL
ncbi:MAG: dynamin family protein [Pseudomonadales bacterium]